LCTHYFQNNAIWVVKIRVMQNTLIISSCHQCNPLPETDSIPSEAVTWLIGVC